ncbi:MAG TPA: four helix bundle protein [Candidatus Hydrogenedentes bacterium]|nr:four helix bundle protein [Candidatus Hydrogenedentota bacterium]
MRDHTKLRAFELADELVLEIYTATKAFPKEEMFGLTSQLRRAALSIASNIVEGCARTSSADFLHFLDMAYGSAREVEYQVSVAYRLGYFYVEMYKTLKSKCEETGKVLNGLIRSLRTK